jgi:radical S-adenosyl methionine domain-containing protein 2
MPTPVHDSRPVSVNFHLFKPCNLRCRFCFATFRDVRGRLPVGQARLLLEQLALEGTEKVTFVGGEPTLHPEVGQLVRHAHEIGLTTCLVTNGARLDALLDRQPDTIDWVGLSVDSPDEAIQSALGRGDGTHVAGSLRLADRCRELGIRLKLNSVVTALNHLEDASACVRRFAPERWKVFQVLALEGQNDGSVEDLLISDSQFAGYVARHGHLAAEGLAPIVEDNDAMTSSYVMVDPLGRFIGNSTGRHVYSEPILRVGVSAALRQVDWSAAKFDERGGNYDWRRAPQQAASRSAASLSIIAPDTVGAAALSEGGR